MRLALNIIAKDENSELKRIIGDYGKYFDEIVIAYDFDTAIEGIEQTEKVKLFKYEWCNDFSHKRNFTAEKTESEYYLRLDTDDVIENPEGIRDVFEKSVSHGFDVIYFPYIYSRDIDGNCNAQHWRETIVKKKKGVYWKKPIHENIFAENASQFKGIKCDAVKIIHNLTDEHAKESNDRNLQYLLEEFYRDKEKTDPRTLSYIGRVLVGRGRYKEAIPFLEQLIQRSGWDDDKYYAWIHMAEAYHQLGDLTKAIACCNEALEINTKFPDAYIRKGSFYLYKGDFQKALDWVMPGLVRPVADTTFVVDPTITTITGNIFACLSYMGLGDFDKAILHLNVVKKLSPKNPFVANHEKEIIEAKESNDFVANFKRILASVVAGGKKPDTLFDLVPDKYFRDERLWLLKHSVCEPTIWSKNSIAIFCGNSWEEWADPSVISGIGGSEEAVIYISRELVKLGYEVTVFNNCGEMEGTYNGVRYLNQIKFNPKDRFNILISWRHNIFKNGMIRAKKNIVWLHDVPDNDQLTGDGIDKIIVLSDFHKSLLKDIPEEKILVSSNGINLKDFVDRGIERNPKRMIYTSSYDRGLVWLLAMWPEIISSVPEAELHIFYGWNTWMQMEKTGVRNPRQRLAMQKLMEQKGVFDHGRVGHKQLIKEFYKSGIYSYPSHFEEISCISGMKAQACGCVPVTTDYAALNETIKSGVKIQGKAGNDAVNASYKNALLFLLNNPERQELHRQEALKLKDSFGWDLVAKQWNKELFTK